MKYRHRGPLAGALLSLSLTFSFDARVNRLAFAQDEQMSKSPEKVARALSENGKIVIVPTEKGKAKRKIEKDEQKFALTYGESPAVLFKLPDYTAPYMLKVTSSCNCVGFKKTIFFPSGVFLDSEFKETHRFEEDDFDKTLRATFEINNERTSDRYLLVYTRGDLLGKLATEAGWGGIPVQRSAHGTLEVEVATKKK